MARHCLNEGKDETLFYIHLISTMLQQYSIGNIITTIGYYRENNYCKRCLNVWHHSCSLKSSRNYDEYSVYRDVNEAREEWVRPRPLARCYEAKENWGRDQRCCISYKNAKYERLRSHNIYQYQEITPSMAVTTVSVHCSKINFSRILEYYKASNNFLSQKNVT